MTFKAGDHVVLNDKRAWKITKPGSKGIIVDTRNPRSSRDTGTVYTIEFYYIPGKGKVTNTRFAIECICVEPLVTSFLDIK